MRVMDRVAVLCLCLALTLGAAGCKLMDQLKARNHLNHGVSEYTAKRYDTAAESFIAAIELDPELVDAYVYLATTYRTQFMPLVQNPENLEMGKRAIASFEKVLELQPDHRTAMINIADIYRNMDRPEESKNWYRRLMEIDQDQSEALYGIGAINYSISNEKTGADGANVENLTEEEIEEVNRIIDEGIEALRKATEIRPNYSEAMEFLNLLYRERALLAEDEEERRRWRNEADKLALAALEARRQQQREAEKARREMFSGKSQPSGNQ